MAGRIREFRERIAERIDKKAVRIQQGRIGVDGISPIFV
jgi:hypothetical protein